MNKKVVAFIGSPRENGNTATIVGEILQGAQATGAATQVFSLNNMNLKPCQGCFHCRGAQTCAINDDMQKVYEAIKIADAVVIGSPVYMHQVTAQTKLLFDRLFPLMDAQFQPRFGSKKTAMVYCQGDPHEKTFKTAFDDNAAFLAAMGLNIMDTIVAAGANDLKAASANPELLTRARAIGMELGK